MGWSQLESWRLRNAPSSVRALAWGYVVALALGYVYAIGNIALVVGLTPDEIARHYYGTSGNDPSGYDTSGADSSPLWSETDGKGTEGGLFQDESLDPDASQELAFDLEEFEETLRDEMMAPMVKVPGPSFKALVTEGHFHLFGMSSFFFGLCLLTLFTGVAEKLKTGVIGASFLFIVLDNLSFMATRFLGPQFAWFTAFSGGFMGLCFGVQWCFVVFELLKKRESL